jgi:hypothetical protein
MRTRLRVYTIATAAVLLAASMFLLTGHYIVQLLNAIFGHHAPSHYNVTRIL